MSLGRIERVLRRLAPGNGGRYNFHFLRVVVHLLCCWNTTG